VVLEPLLQVHQPAKPFTGSSRDGGREGGGLPVRHPMAWAEAARLIQPALLQPQVKAEGPHQAAAVL